MEGKGPIWQNVADELPQKGKRVMLVNSKFPSGYPVFAVMLTHQQQPYWRLMPQRINADFAMYDMWAYTGQPSNPHDPAYAQS